MWKLVVATAVFGILYCGADFVPELDVRWVLQFLGVTYVTLLVAMLLCGLGAMTSFIGPIGATLATAVAAFVLTVGLGLLDSIFGLGLDTRNTISIVYAFCAALLLLMFCKGFEKEKAKA